LSSQRWWQLSRW